MSDAYCFEIQLNIKDIKKLRLIIQLDKICDYFKLQMKETDVIQNRYVGEDTTNYGEYKGRFNSETLRNDVFDALCEMAKTVCKSFKDEVSFTFVTYEQELIELDPIIEKDKGGNKIKIPQCRWEVGPDSTKEEMWGGNNPIIDEPKGDE